VIDAEKIPMHGGSLRVVAGLDPNARVSARVKELLQYEAKEELTHTDTWMTFGGRVSRTIEVVRETMGRLSEKSRIWGYGAAGKATMWVNACRMSYLEGMVDSSPLRAGRLMPGTHTPILFPDKLKVDPPEYIFVTAWNYLDLIRSKEAWFRGVWTVPLPELRFL
jgi:hypothetical protein